MEIDLRFTGKVKITNFHIFSSIYNISHQITIKFDKIVVPGMQHMDNLLEFMLNLVKGGK